MSTAADGKWLAYTVGGGPNGLDVYLQAFPDPAGRIQISNNGGAFPVWSWSGRELFFVTRDLGLASVSIDTAGSGILPSTPRILFRAPIVFAGSVAPLALSPDDQRFLMAASGARAARPIVVTTGWPSLFSAER